MKKLIFLASLAIATFVSGMQIFEKNQNFDNLNICEIQKDDNKYSNILNQLENNDITAESRKIGNFAMIPVENSKEFIFLQSSMGAGFCERFAIETNTKGIIITGLDLILMTSTKMRRIIEVFNDSIFSKPLWNKKDQVNVRKILSGQKDLTSAFCKKVITGLANYYICVQGNVYPQSEETKCSDITNKAAAKNIISLFTALKKNYKKMNPSEEVVHFLSLFFEFLKRTSVIKDETDVCYKDLYISFEKLPSRALDYEQFTNAIKWGRYAFHTEAQFVVLNQLINKNRIVRKDNSCIKIKREFFSERNPCHSCQQIPWVYGTNQNMWFKKIDSRLKKDINSYMKNNGISKPQNFGSQIQKFWKKWVSKTVFLNDLFL